MLEPCGGGDGGVLLMECVVDTFVNERKKKRGRPRETLSFIVLKIRREAPRSLHQPLTPNRTPNYRKFTINLPIDLRVHLICLGGNK